MTKKTLEKLQEDHSEMCATAADLGMKVPADLTVDFDSVEVGATVCDNLDALIRQFRQGLEEEEQQELLEVLAADVEEEQTEVEAEPAKPVKEKKKKAPKSKKTSAASTEAIPAEADQEGVTDVAAAAKKTAKKAVSKANGKAAPKTAKVKAAKKAGGKPGSRFPDEGKITWITGKKNPAREGAGRHGRIDKLMKSSGKTVKAFVASGGNPETLRNCVKAGLCKIA